MRGCYLSTDYTDRFLFVAGYHDGKLTDSRSFLSYPRHEYFRRILCNLIGTDIENGEIPYIGYEAERMNQMVEDICYNNAKNYFKF